MLISASHPVYFAPIMSLQLLASCWQKVACKAMASPIYRCNTFLLKFQCKMSKSMFPIRKGTKFFAPSTNSNVVREQGPSKIDKKNNDHWRKNNKLSLEIANYNALKLEMHGICKGENAAMFISRKNLQLLLTRTYHLSIDCHNNFHWTIALSPKFLVAFLL